MGWMFSDCESLESLNLSNFDTSNVTDMRYMFDGCYKLRTIYMRNCSQTTIDKIKDALSEANILDQVTIIT